jgi:hypothetical protein
VSDDHGRSTFALRGCRDLLEKLRSEISSLVTIERHDVMTRAYIVFNCAVTTWHMTDWVWAELDAEQWKRIQACAGTSFIPQKTDPRPLQEFARHESDALGLCELVANGSKHCVLRKPPSLNISLKITNGDGVTYGNPVVVVDGKERLFEEVLWQAEWWWRAFLTDWRVAEEPPFIPDGDGDGPPLPLSSRRL